MYKLIEGSQGWTAIAEDGKYGTRGAAHVRLEVIGTTDTIFFINTHGPLYGGCGRDVGEKWSNVIKTNILTSFNARFCLNSIVRPVKKF